MGLSAFDSLKQYVGFTEQSSAALRELHPVARPFFVPIVDDFYAAIEAHPEARAAISGGAATIARLKQTLVRWLDELLLGPHDEGYYQRRARIGRVHVQIALPQAFMFTAMNRIRIQLLDIVGEGAPAGRVSSARRIATAVNQILDLELAIMLETYREDLEARNRASERLATIGQFAAGIGHEIRNPLGVIESSLFLLRQHVGPEVAAAPNVAKHLNRIAGEITRANKTIQDLLNLARNRPPHRQRVEVRRLVEAAAYAASLPEGVEVKVTATPPDLAIDVDPDQIQQVLVNLFINAAQAMPGGGRIDVTGEATASPAGARLRVQDQGPGVAAEAQHRLFEALFTTKSKGSGLGLALCRRIMEGHGGTIDLERAQPGAGAGAIFVLVVPAVAAAAVAVAGS